MCPHDSYITPFTAHILPVYSQKSQHVQSPALAGLIQWMSVSIAVFSSCVSWDEPAVADYIKAQCPSKPFQRSCCTQCAFHLSRLHYGWFNSVPQREFFSFFFVVTFHIHPCQYCSESLNNTCQCHQPPFLVSFKWPRVWRQTATDIPYKSSLSHIYCKCTTPLKNHYMVNNTRQILRDVHVSTDRLIPTVT